MDFHFEFDNNRDLQLLFGRYDQNLKIIEKELGVRIVRSEDGIKIIGSDAQAQKASELFHYLMTFVEKGKDVKKADIVYALRLVDKEKEIDFKDEAIEYIIEEYSETEKGVRNLIRTVETMMTRLNMLRVSNHETMKEYGFYMEFTNPFVITIEVVKKLLFDFDKKESESWKSMYT